MRTRGQRLDLFGMPLWAVLVIFVVLTEPGFAADATAPGDPGVPRTANQAPQDSIAAGSVAPGQPTAGPGAAGATAGPIGPGPTPAPTTGSISNPTSGPAAGQTLAPTRQPTPAATPAPPPTVAPPTPAPTAAPVAIPALSACSVFPSTNVWNRRVDELPVAANSATMVGAIGLDASLHPDFSDAGGYGIPFNVVGASTPRSTVSFQYGDESDHVGYPIPASPKIEGGSDRHLLMIDTNSCTLFELFAASHGSGSWSAGSGAVWNLGSNELRPDGWTSADAGGLPIFPGLVRWSEVASGAIHHAIRFTAPQTCDDHWLYPARHEAGSGSCDSRPPMGLRVRLRADVDISGFGPQSRVILAALQQYGMLLADNGSPWYITGAPDGHWDDDELHDLGQLTGADFEVVDTTGFVNG
jgi:hypothetical protein